MIEDLYTNVLCKLPFSVTGHVDIEKKLDKFFEHLIVCKFIEDHAKHGLTLLFSSLLDIPKDSSRDKNKIEDWELNSFNHIYSHTFFEHGNYDPINFYFFLLKWAGKELNIQKFSSSLVLSRFFLSDLDFRVRIDPKNELEDPEVRYIVGSHVFEIIVPKQLFKLDKKNGLKAEISKLNTTENGFLKQIASTCRYDIDELKNEKSYEETLKKIIDIDKVVDIVAKIVKKFNNPKNFKCSYKNDQNLYKEIAYCSICLSFLSLYYDNSYIEYMLSIAKVNPNFGLYTGTEPPEEYRNIGGLVLGYRNDLNDERRAIYNLISDRIAVAVAGQYLVEEANLTNKGYEILKDFDKKYFKCLTHDGSKEEEIIEKVDRVMSSRRLGNLKKILTEETYNSIINYITGLKQANDKKLYIQENGERIKAAIRFKPAEWAETLKKEFNIELGPNIIKCYDYVLMDMQFLDDIIRYSISNSTKGKAKKNSHLISLDLLMQNNEKKSTTNFNEAILIQLILSDTGSQGCNLKNLPSNSSTYEALNKDRASVVDAIGGVFIESLKLSVNFIKGKKEYKKIRHFQGFRTTINLYKPLS